MACPSDIPRQTFLFWGAAEIFIKLLQISIGEINPERSPGLIGLLGTVYC